MKFVTGFLWCCLGLVAGFWIANSIQPPVWEANFVTLEILEPESYKGEVSQFVGKEFHTFEVPADQKLRLRVKSIEAK